MRNKFYSLSTKSLEAEGVATYAELWDKVKSDSQGFCMTVDTSFEKSAMVEGTEMNNRYRVIMSTGIKDRHGEIVFQNWDLENFKKNPVFLDSHNYGSIEHIIGKVVDIAVDNGRLVGDVEFATENPKGYLAMRLAEGGFLNATSVGFIPLAFDNDGNITKAELLEDSAVSVPANAEALFERSIKSYEEADEVVDEVTGQEEETPVEEDSEEVTEEETPVEVKSETPDTYAVLIKKLQAQTSVMKAVAKQLQETKPQTLAERKRKILRDLRQVL